MILPPAPVIETEYRVLPSFKPRKVADKVFWLTFIDTTDPNVGAIDVDGRKVLYSHIINQVNSSLSSVGYKNDVQDFYGSATSPENCKSAIEKLKVSHPDDIIVFYYIGHGGRPLSDMDYMLEHPWPQMCMAQHYDEKFIPLEWVDSQLKAKGARLAVTIGMCCNSVSPSVTKKSSPEFSISYGPTYMSSQKIDNINNLFLGETGSVLATSALPTQTSGCCTSPFGVIDTYTAVLASIFDELDYEPLDLNWHKLLTVVSSEVDAIMASDQTPFHTTNLTEAYTAAPSQNSTPQKPDTKKTQNLQENNSSTEIVGSRDWVNSLEDNFQDLINVSLPQADRIALEQDLNSLFAPDAKVRFLGQDSDTVIDREESDVFLGRLATSKLILNVAIVEAELNSKNKITSLKVREIYKK